ncbi:hypothetical protein SS1G_13462 [Sclerotinia sclerotiorum 1980 UF-70]|uniref:RING-type domain-containing protein n=1 Tax=Sclerotinia sclerotiorum (strain ATCC 18683 / 1980 / Ss-1) TaxID=665079 RepID=A7F782_SCLS1|nr:hypothetical protein SS1G_13462 [Sclerotinia sclerotiorum 1980 UF-70]EDN98603.1 hypothetical protein SS1G_13462 [Sclerotinia sclerotiorum 1980 UF-70]
MALTSWKTFDFFEVSQVKPPDDESKSIFENNEISCVCSGSENIFVGSYDGTEDLSHEPVLKVWALDKPVKKTGLPTCQSTLISAFTAMDDLSQLAVGFGNGAVTVIRGDLIHDRGAKQRTVHESEEPITGLAFREEERLINLYIATTSRLVKLVISGRAGQSARPVEDSGCGIHRYHEKPLQQRLETLYQRNLYVHAINLAQKAGMDSKQQNIIFRKSGDFLYQKGDYDGAMQQYLKAIDSTEPSQVIRKYLDTQRIHNLIEYLEELHEHHKATADHTTLLLNCYAKLKDIDKLEKFIKSPGDLKFDLDTAITMCRQGGYYEQAAYLATKHGEHEPMKDVVITSEAPVQHAGYAAGAAGVAVNAVANMRDLIPLPFMNTSTITSPATIGNVNSIPADGQVLEVVEPPPPAYSPPQPRTAFSSFVDHPEEFIVFLEACLKDPGLKERDKIDLYTTLFEMYLHKSNQKNGRNREEWESKAKKLIEGEDIPIDISNVLLLSHLSDFKDGTTLVREQAGLRFDIFRSYTAAKDTAGAIKALRKYGPEEPQLYPAALAYFTSDPRILEEAGDELDAVLEKIDTDGLMAPLQVIQTLSTNAVATMGMIKTYLQQTIQRERKEIATNRRVINSYRTDTQTKRQEIAELSTKPQTFNATRCSFCGMQLDLPTVHFLCKHSFHQRCLKNDDEGNVEGDCPTCKKENDTIKAIRRGQDETAERHDLFLDMLGRSRDKFGTVAEFFGRGVMEVPGVE